MAAGVLAAVVIAGCGADDGPITVRVDGDIDMVLDGANLTALQRLERHIADESTVAAVNGPAGHLARAAARDRKLIAEHLPERPEPGDRRALAEYRQRKRELPTRLGYEGAPSLTNRPFVQTVVLGAGIDPKPQLAALFPDADHARITVRPRDGISGDQREELEAAIDELIEATRLDPELRLERG